jgi:hypothetical protein
MMRLSGIGGYPIRCLMLLPEGLRTATGVWLALVLVLLAPTVMAQEAVVRDLATALASDLDKAATALHQSEPVAVAVVDFTNLRGCVSEVGRFLAEEVSVALVAHATHFQVIDRTHLQAIIREHKLGASGLIDVKTAQRLGEIAGAETLVTATLIPFKESIRVSAKVLHTRTARILGAATAMVPRTSTIEELLATELEVCPGSSAAPVEAPASPPRRPPVSAHAQGAATPHFAKLPMVRMDGIEFHSLGCKASAEGPLTCEATVKNTGNRPTTFKLVPDSSYFTDQAGNQYRASRQWIGTHAGSGHDWVKEELVVGVPVKFGFVVDTIPRDLSSLSLAIKSETSLRDFWVTLPDVPVSH